ncbi:MAG: quinone oxidoreductase [Rhodospirillales bacterium]|nr:MAG: quinone oxidoreductase [Rhodospirillales bacterium]
MKAIGVNEFGGPETLHLLDLDRPQPGPGEVLVKVDYAGVNYIDVYMRSGIYKRSTTYETPLPMVLGMEGAGTVETWGPEVEGFRPGDAVAWCLARGAYAEYAVVPAWRLVRIPAGVPPSVATALMLQGMTAHYLSHSAFPLEAGQTCLIHAAAGGVGQLLVQLAKLRGARVIATVGTREKAELAGQRGADHCILYREEDFLPVVRRLTDGEGVDVVYDSVGRETIARSIRSLRRRGTCIMYGTSSGFVDCIAPLELAEAGSVFFTRPHLADYTADADEIAWRAGMLFEVAAGSRLVVTIDREFPLAEARGAHETIEGRRTQGKLLLRTGA